MHILYTIVLILLMGASNVWADEKMLMNVKEVTANLANYRKMAQSTLNTKEISVKSLAAGVEYYNSLIHTGYGTVSYFIPQAEHNIEKLTKAIFIFDKRMMRVDNIEGPLAGRNIIYNGEIQISINKKYNKRTKEWITMYGKEEENTINTDLDPRRWYNIRATGYLEHPIEELIQSSNARLVGKEQVDGKPCYIINLWGNIPEAPELLWICPDIGFRIVKVYHRYIEKGEIFVTHYRFSYKEYKQKEEAIWLPQRVEHMIFKVNAKDNIIGPSPKFGPNIFIVYDDFQVNLDVSSHFKPRFKRGILIFDVSSSRQIPVEQLLPDFIEK